MQIDNIVVCFLCKRAVDVTDEHVFPKWLQNRFNLWDKSVILKNSSLIRYRELKIPCCSECNTKHLSKIETVVSSLLEKEDISGMITESESLFIWLYKIMFGINYKEIFLSSDRRQPNSPKIVTDESLLSRDTYNLFLRFVRKEVFFEGFAPYSLFVFRLTDSTPTTYYYASEPYAMFASAIIGNIGLVASFQDDGYISRDIERNNFLNGLKELSIPQFGDFAAFVLHLKTRMNMLPDYLVTPEKGRLIIRVERQPEYPLYADFTGEKQMELVYKFFRFCFDRLIQEGEDGSKEINYRSPFNIF